MPRIITGCNADDDAAVGIAFIARILAHAIGDHASRFRGGGHYGTARAHAKAIDRAAIPAVMHQLVIGRAEQRMPGVLAVSRAVNERLRMFDAKPDRKGLGLDINSPIVEHLKGIARAMADGQDDMVGGDSFPAGEHHATHLAASVMSLFYSHVRNLTLKADLSTQRTNGLA